VKLINLTIAGIRGFNSEQTLEFDGDLVIYAGPNGAGKTSIGESLEWLLYGRTLKRSKGDEISKREYAESYRNAHYTGSQKPYVNAEIVDGSGARRVIRRELRDDETSVLTLDCKQVSGLDQLGLGTTYDRPLILQHTLQDFIFMKPKTRYEVLSAMLGLEPLIAFRNAVEQAKNELSKRLPARVVEAQGRRAALLREFSNNALLNPVAVAINHGKLADAHKHLRRVALGTVPSGTPEAELERSLMATKAAKQRAQLDWGRFSLNPISAPQAHPAVSGLEPLTGLLEDFHSKLGQALAAAQTAAEMVPDLRTKQFVSLGLELRGSTTDLRCPFCLEDTLTPEKVAELRRLAEYVPASRPSIASAEAALRNLQNALQRHRGSLGGLIPTFPSEQEAATIRELATGTQQQIDSYFAATENLQRELGLANARREALTKSVTATLDAILQGSVPQPSTPELATALREYRESIVALPGAANAYAATYATLDPFIKMKLASAEEVRFLDLLGRGLDAWKDIEVAQQADAMGEILQDTIRQTRQFIEAKQKEVLGVRDKDIRAWYDLLNPGAQVGYEGIVPGTDSLELRARSFVKIIMAAPNLSASQLNCIGLAVYLACATRATSPHEMIFFDDPVQSMDDEHVEAFKKDLIKNLLDRGFQVILLTHMDNFADDIEKLYRARARTALFRMEAYALPGPTVTWRGPEIGHIMQQVRKDKDSLTEGFRKQAVQELRQFVERFVKDLYTAETGKSVSKRFEDKNWSDLKPLLRQCKSFDPADEPRLEDTHKFTSKFMHTDATQPSKTPSPAQINPHYSDMDALMNKYKKILGL
jgi:DNA repair exonuclease SbcCD ATPase subunit